MQERQVTARSKSIGENTRTIYDYLGELFEEDSELSVTTSVSDGLEEHITIELNGRTIFTIDVAARIGAPSTQLWLLDIPIDMELSLVELKDRVR